MIFTTGFVIFFVCFLLLCNFYDTTAPQQANWVVVCSWTAWVGVLLMVLSLLILAWGWLP